MYCFIVIDENHITYDITTSVRGMGMTIVGNGNVPLNFEIREVLY